MAGCSASSLSSYSCLTMNTDSSTTNATTSASHLESTSSDQEMTADDINGADGGDSSAEEDARTQSETESDRDDEIILSVYWRSGKLGAAMYSLQNPVVHVLYDVVDDFLLGFKILRSLFIQVQPTQVVTCKSMQQKFQKLLHELLTGEENGDDNPQHSNIHILPDAEFRGDNSKRRVLALRLPDEPEDWPENEHVNFMYSILDLSQESAIHALARLLKYLDQNLRWLDLSNKQYRVLSIRNMCLDDVMWVNKDTYNALQIFSHTSHPSLFKWTEGVYKEGLSIYGFFNRCHSKLGSKYMRSQLARPTTDLSELKKRHDVITFCFHPGHEDLVRKMQNCIKQIHSISGILPKFLAAQATIPQWKTLNKTIRNILLLRETCSQFSHHMPFFEKVESVVTTDLYRVHTLINRIIDFPSSEERKKFVVLPGIDAELDIMRQQEANLPTIMHKLGPLEMNDLPSHVEECSVMYIPEIGFLLAIRMWKHSLTEEEISIPGLEYKFTANRILHFKSGRCHELDNTVGDISLRISQVELRIMLKLVQFIQPHIQSLLDALVYVGELDCLLAMAEVAKENNYVKPTMTQGHEIIIEKGRHPLQETCVNNYVPNDTFSSEQHGLVKILTGPNASGKSVYLKQVALIAYLAHTGSFVPAKMATIGVLDQIHTRIKAVESIASQLSSFMLDLRQMNTSICHSTRSSLLVIDEFGKGTSEDDGLPLLAACVSHLLNRGPQQCPHVFVSTHFHRLIDLLPNHPLVTSQILDHTVSDGELIYLFQLKEGRISSSMALEVARASGIPDSIINRAEKVLQAIKTGPPVEPLRDHKKIISQKKSVIS